MKKGPSQLAAIDMGTNTLRLECFHSLSGDDSKLKIFLRKLSIIRLGEGFDSEKVLIPKAIERALKALDEMLFIIKGLKIESVCIAATGVVREAGNQQAFFDIIKEKTGISLRILGGEEEARLSLKGVNATIRDITFPLLVCDIGGGSTEMAMQTDNKNIWLLSLPLGAVRILEALKLKAPLCNSSRIRLLDEINRALNDNIPHDCFIDSGMINTFAATALTATTLASIDVQSGTYSPYKTHGHKMDLKRIREIFLFISTKNLSMRKGIAGLMRGREDIIVPGLAILICIMERFGLKDIVISEGGLLEGIIAEEYESIYKVCPEIII